MDKLTRQYKKKKLVYSFNDDDCVIVSSTSRTRYEIFTWNCNQEFFDGILEHSCEVFEDWAEPEIYNPEVFLTIWDWAKFQDCMFESFEDFMEQFEYWLITKIRTIISETTVYWENEEE